MPFSSKPHYILYIRSGSVDLHSLDGTVSRRLVLTPQIIANQEVVNPEALLKLLPQLFSSLNVTRKNFCIVLGSDIVFTKATTAEHLQIFLDNLPLDPEKITFTTYKTSKNFYALAVNKSLYSVITSFLTTIPASVVSVLPAAFIKEFNQAKLDTKTLRSINFNSLTLKKLNFLTPNTLAPKIKSTSKKPLALVLLVILILALALLAGYFLVKNRAPLPPAPVTAAATPTPEITEIPQPSPEPELSLDPAVFSINIVNAGSPPGSATVLKTLLTEAGFELVSASNSSQVQTVTTIDIKPVWDPFFDQLTAYLPENYQIATSSSFLEPDSPFDAIITLGQ